MSRYLEEYDPYMDYYKKACMDEVLGMTHCQEDDEVFLDPASPLKCRKCQNQIGTSRKPPKPSKPLKSSKSFLGGLRKSRSAEALQSLRVNVSCMLPKSPSSADTREKSPTKSRLKFLSRFKRMMTTNRSENSQNTPLKPRPSCSSLAPSLDSQDSKQSDSDPKLLGGISFRTAGGCGGLVEGVETPSCRDCEAVRRRFTVIEDQYGDISEEDQASGIYKYQSIRRNNPKSKHLSIGRKKFNMDPKKGIEYLIEHGLLQNTPEDIAQFLHKGEGLNKTAIGDYLGERTEFNIAVLKCFVSLHEFADMILVQALRQFLWSFRLPGEAQKIDRMMECFAERYCNSNAGVFTSTDTCYVLSFAIIMLNTSLHNPAVKDKPTVDRFINMNRGINDGGDLPIDLLTSIYENIKKEPFKFPEDDGNDLMHTFFNPDKEGWLWKQGTSKLSGRYKNWKRRWFILNDNCLYYFEFTTDKEPKGIIPLENIQVRETTDRNKANCFELFNENNEVIKACKTDSEGKVVEGKHHVYRMSASTPEEQDEWKKCITASISEHPFYDMLAARRKKAQMKAKK